MAKIKKLKEEMLVGGESQVDVYPVTTSQAIYSQDSNGNVRTRDGQPEKLEDRLVDHEEDAAELHLRTESIELSLSNNMNNQIIEISNINTGNSFTISLTGSATVKNYGDYPTKPLNLNNASIITTKGITNKNLSVMFNAANLQMISQGASGNNWYGTCDLSQGASKKTIGTYTCTFSSRLYTGTESELIKTSTPKYTYIGLRLYAGFTSEESATIDQDISTWTDLEPYLSRMDRNKVVYSNSTFILTFPAVSGDVSPDTRYIHFAVPAPLRLTALSQPDGLGQDLAFVNTGNVIQRTIGGVDYDYNLYRTELPQFSWRQLRLTLTLS